MAELADALDSGSNGRKAVQVQVLLPAPKIDKPHMLLVDFILCQHGIGRSRCGSDSPPDCHSLPSRRYATR